MALCAAWLHADEGMWMPQQMPELGAKLKALGFKGDPKEFADLTGQPMGAVVSLGGCTASFVSPDGLIVTNHHCAAGALQFNSTPQRNLLLDGFLAKTREEELPNGRDRASSSRPRWSMSPAPFWTAIPRRRPTVSATT